MNTKVFGLFGIVAWMMAGLGAAPALAQDAANATAAIPAVWFVAPIAAIAALLMAVVFFNWMKSNSEGDENMVEIAEAVRQGAMAYLSRQYKVVGLVFVMLVGVLAILSFGLGLQPKWSLIGVPVAGLFSGLCGWFGMRTATHASARTTFAAKHSLNDGLKVAFRSGAVMGLVVVGFALLDISIWFFLFNTVLGGMTLQQLTIVMLSYGMGASTQALFARVGGGIYTKAADVGADLVGKVEAGIPEDDPRNPATIADNVGDNVGDVAGMGADLYESYYGSILATMALGAAAAFSVKLTGSDESTKLALALAAAPIALAGIGIICSILGVFTVKAKENASFNELLKGLHKGVYVASGLIVLGAFGLLYLLFGKNDAGTLPFVWWGLGCSIVAGLAAGLVIAHATEYYTSYEHPPTRRIAEQALTGPATVIIAGIAEGMKSTWASLLTVVIAIIAAFGFAGGGDNFLMGLYGVGIAAVGMLSTLGITLATDAYGPIADNAGGNAEMTGQPPHVRERTDMLDALGNTTAATGKGFAIGSAALTAMALLAAYVQVVQQQQSTQAVEWAEGRTIAENVGTYRGYGQWAVNAEGAIHGGLSIAPDHLVKTMRKDHAVGKPVNVQLGEYDDDSNAWNVTYAGAHFRVVRADKASIRDLMIFYNVTLMNPRVLGGLFLGVLLAFVFCALTMNAVGRAAYRMMGECRRQFGKMREAFKAQGMSDEDIKDPMKWPTKVQYQGIQYPQYAECVAISTAGAQREMVLPASLAILVPIVVGLILGVPGVIGMLMGGLTSGFAIAIYMANAGGAWDNAKKYIETGHHGGKGSDAHKAGVVGDTVGDPFKDTSGPSLNILIKLISIVSVVFAGLIVKYAPMIGEIIGLG